METQLAQKVGLPQDVGFSPDIHNPSLLELPNEWRDGYPKLAVFTFRWKMRSGPWQLFWGRLGVVLNQ